jgi:hypothetical protein
MTLPMPIARHDPENTNGKSAAAVAAKTRLADKPPTRPRTQKKR